MKRRSFLQFLGLAPAAAVAPKLAEAMPKAPIPVTDEVVELMADTHPGWSGVSVAGLTLSMVNYASCSTLVEAWHDITFKSSGK